MSFLAVALGIGLLAYAADQFVIGAARVALLLRMPALVVGVVIVGFGTSAPELLVSMSAVLGDQPEIAVGNILGSNAANLTLLLGLGALLCPVVVESRTVRREAPIAVGAMVAVALAVQGGINRFEGLALLAAMAAALVLVIRRDSVTEDALDSEVEEFAGPDHRLTPEIVRTVLGLAGTLAGAELLLRGAIDIARDVGLSEAFIGVTLVAVGTSLPELVTVIQSARRNEADLVVGNLLGSNLFNSLVAGGLIGVVKPFSLDAPSLTTVAAGAGVIVGFGVWAMMRTGHRVSRAEGMVLVGAYAVLVPLLA